VRTIPAVRELYQQYQAQGLIVIGVHSPEFQHEHDVNNVKNAIARLDVPYPVALDNDFATWQAFGNRYWPSLYLIDRRGIIRYNHIGELHQDTAAWTEITELIETVLKE
jgi:alkyl hydroperoxide reductase subunit AhpC